METITNTQTRGGILSNGFGAVVLDEHDMAYLVLALSDAARHDRHSGFPATARRYDRIAAAVRPLTYLAGEDS